MPCPPDFYSGGRDNDRYWHNWLGNLSYIVPSYFQPSSRGDLVWILQQAETQDKKVKAVGHAGSDTEGRGRFQGISFCGEKQKKPPGLGRADLKRWQVAVSPALAASGESNAMLDLQPSRSGRSGSRDPNQSSESGYGLDSNSAKRRGRLVQFPGLEAGTLFCVRRSDWFSAGSYQRGSVDSRSEGGVVLSLGSEPCSDFLPKRHDLDERLLNSTLPGSACAALQDLLRRSIAIPAQ